MDFTNNDNLTIILLIAGFLLSRIPVVGKYFRGVNTLIHETGHALMALITSGEVLAVELFSDTSGTTITKSKGKFGQFLIAICGYPFSSAAALLLFYLIKIDAQMYIILILTAIAILNLIFLVRNWYGIFWLLSFIAILIGVWYNGNKTLIFATTVMFSGIVLTESIYSALQLVIIAFKNSSNSGDAKNLSGITFIPPIIWAILFLLQSIYFAYCVVKLYSIF